MKEAKFKVGDSVIYRNPAYGNGEMYEFCIIKEVVKHQKRTYLKQQGFPPKGEPVGELYDTFSYLIELFNGSMSELIEEHLLFRVNVCIHITSVDSKKQIDIKEIPTITKIFVTGKGSDVPLQLESTIAVDFKDHDSLKKVVFSELNKLIKEEINAIILDGIEITGPLISVETFFSYVEEFDPDYVWNQEEDDTYFVMGTCIIKGKSYSVKYESLYERLSLTDKEMKWN